MTTVVSTISLYRRSDESTQKVELTTYQAHTLLTKHRKEAHQRLEERNQAEAKIETIQVSSNMANSKATLELARKDEIEHKHGMSELFEEMQTR